MKRPCCEQLGYPRDELLTLSVPDVDPGYDAAKLAQLLEQVTPGVPFTLEGTSLRRKDGTTFPVEVRLGSIELDGRQCFFGLVRDITERKQAEEALRQSEERYRALFEQSSDAIVITVHSKVVDANQACLDLFGYTRDEALKIDLAEVYVDPAARARFRQEIDTNGSVREFEVKFRKKDGTQMECLLTATWRRAPDGTGLEVQNIVRDITARKRAEEALLQQTRELAVLEERNRLAREIHDTLAQGFTGIVLQLEAAEQALEESPTEAAGHLRRAKNLARESLQEARRSVWDLRAQALEARSLEAALQEELRRFAAEGQEKTSFSLSRDRRQLPPPIEAALLRICQESLTNMRRHARATEVRVNIAFYRDSVCLSVQDNGAGFDVAEVKANGRAGGFGLAGMEERARLLGGTLAVHSEKGKGTLVEVRIPTAKEVSTTTLGRV